jgi:uncharacterized membrane protein YjjP (DUF1212 family)
MTNRTIALINALTLVVFAGWAYLEKGAPTALIPVFLGNIIWIFARRLQGDNAKQAFNIVLALTAITFLALFMPLNRQLKSDDTMGVIRSSIMLLVTGTALVAYIRRYITGKAA